MEELFGKPAQWTGAFPVGSGSQTHPPPLAQFESPASHTCPCGAPEMSEAPETPPSLPPGERTHYALLAATSREQGFQEQSRR